MYFLVKIVINVEIATRAKIVMARNGDEDDDLCHDHHVPRRLLLAVLVSFEQFLVTNIIEKNVCDIFWFLVTLLSFKMKVMKNVKNVEENVANEKNANVPNE